VQAIKAAASEGNAAAVDAIREAFGEQSVAGDDEDWDPEDPNN
jgi:hypothetical protein